MKVFKIKIGLFLGFVALMLQGCETESALYDGPDLVHFSEVSSQMVIKEREENKATITVGSTTVSSVDRTYTIKILTDESTATEGGDFQLSSNTVTIPAGKVISTFDVIGLYDGASSDGTTLKLTIADASAGQLANFNNQYTIDLFKFCSFERDAFIGTYHAYEHSYWGEFEYDIHTQAGSAASVRADGFWGVYGSSIEIVFDAYGATCSIPEQFLFTSSEYGVVHIRSFEDGTINSCNGTIEGLSYYIFDSETMTLWDICTIDMYLKDDANVSSTMTNSESNNRPWKAIDVEMKK
ncbi:hypothetical protein [Carboxylicivirga sp. N1Y90]|uniref:hypothetical protein n=1 Tax=Carboxylicivirga fragile TaxID=3417571 RepID=UPI003D351AAF|nr:hypothetical protein [Marinilabiliaceae bacterium N1Y90]